MARLSPLVNEYIRVGPVADYQTEQHKGERRASEISVCSPWLHWLWQKLPTSRQTGSKYTEKDQWADCNHQRLINLQPGSLRNSHNLLKQSHLLEIQPSLHETFEEILNIQTMTTGKLRLRASCPHLQGIRMSVYTGRNGRIKTESLVRELETLGSQVNLCLQSALYFPPEILTLLLLFRVCACACVGIEVTVYHHTQHMEMFS